MEPLTAPVVALVLAAFVAAVVNGTLGYGFSSILSPVGLWWVSSRVLLPALVLVELGVNAALLIKERRYFRSTYPRIRPMVLGIVPGVLLGSYVFTSISPTDVKAIVYLALLPLILLQLVGFRRRILNEESVGSALGLGIGSLYALTTISGPPLALFWRNQGMAKGEFRCAMAQVRFFEASLTSAAFLAFGLLSPAALGTVPVLLFPVLIGVPIGAVLLQGYTREFFSRVVMTGDGLLTAFGLSLVLPAVAPLTPELSFLLFVLAALAILALSVHTIRRIPFLRATHRFEDRSFGRDPLG